MRRLARDGCFVVSGELGVACARGHELSLDAAVELAPSDPEPE